jgi:hypothetical protein
MRSASATAAEPEWSTWWVDITDFLVIGRVTNHPYDATPPTDVTEAPARTRGAGLVQRRRSQTAALRRHVCERARAAPRRTTRREAEER